MKQESTTTNDKSLRELFNDIKICKEGYEFEQLSTAIKDKVEEIQFTDACKKHGYSDGETAAIAMEYKMMGHSLTYAAGSLNGKNPRAISTEELDRIELSTQLKELKALRHYEGSEEKNTRVTTLENILEQHFEPQEAEVVSSKPLKNDGVKQKSFLGLPLKMK